MSDPRDETFHSIRRIELYMLRWQALAVAFAIVSFLCFAYIGYLVVSVDDLVESADRRSCKDNATAAVLDAFGGSITAAIDGDPEALVRSRQRLDALGSLREQYESCLTRH